MAIFSRCVGGAGRAAAGQVEQQRVADFDRDARLVGTLRGFDLQDVDGAELVAQDRRAVSVERSP